MPSTHKSEKHTSLAPIESKQETEKEYTVTNVKRLCLDSGIRWFGNGIETKLHCIGTGEEREASHGGRMARKPHGTGASAQRALLHEVCA